MPVKKYLGKKSKQLFLTGQIVIKSDSFLKTWQNRQIHVIPNKRTGNNSFTSLNIFVNSSEVK